MPTLMAFAPIANYVQLATYKPEAKAKFLSGADPWLIAKAQITGTTVVTHEVSSPGSKKRVTIPDVCDTFGVKYIAPYEVLRSMAASFTFRPPGK
jgi:hypothetical protein